MSIKQISPEELKNKLDNGEDFVLIDCREQTEWDAGHIPGAVLMPLSNFEEEMEKLKDKNIEIVVQCRSGKRSMNACYMLDDNGHEKLYNLEGGILAWQEDGYPVVED